jgi:crotonobetainyl-CoA:carnitine CoA-transferase CaiB-like acyl-CoA transferase
MHTMESLLEDEHLAATGFFTEVEHPVVGRIRETAVPSEWSGTVPLNRHPGASLGEHTVDVLREAGLGEQRINQLVADNVVFQRPVVSSGRKSPELNLASPSIRHPGDS